MRSLSNLTLVFVLCKALVSHSFPLSPVGTWDVEDPVQEEQINVYLDYIRKGITDRNWTAIDPKEFACHEKFNLCDGLSLDMDDIDELMRAGDPVVKITEQIDKERDEKAKNKGKSMLNWFT